MIVLFPWRTDNRICFGRRAPQGEVRHTYERFEAAIVRRGSYWYAQFADSGLRRFYLEYLLYHEIGHHLDWYYRRWTPANTRKCEEAADQYAITWSRTAKHTINRIEKDRAAEQSIAANGRAHAHQGREE